jgi:hypothetical protein
MFEACVQSLALGKEGGRKDPWKRERVRERRGEEMRGERRERMSFDVS